MVGCRLSLVSILAFGLAAQSHTALAADPGQPTQAAGDQQSSGEGLEQITVTAQKRAENLQDVPIAVSAVSADQLQAAGVQDISQLPTLTSGVTFPFVGGSFEPHMRGIGTTSDGPGLENPVALYVDGVYYASQVSLPHDLFDVAQVSVLKGPQGTLFGRNATAGVIQMTTRDPTQNFEGELQTSLDSYLTTKSNLYLSGGITDDLAANISIMYGYQGDGWGKNLFNGDSVYKIARDLSLRSKWVYTPNDDTTIKVAVDYSNRADSMGLCMKPAPGTKLQLPGYESDGDPWDIDADVKCDERFENGGTSVTVNQNLGFAQLVNIAAYRQFYFTETFLPTATPSPGELLIAPEQGDEITEELQLISPSNPDFNWTAGIYYFNSNEGTGPDGAFPIYFQGPFAPTPTSLGELDINTHVVTSSIAEYGQFTAKILPDTHVTMGLRYNYETKSFNGSEQGILANGIPIGNLPLPSFPSQITTSKPTWRIAFDHNISDSILAYISYNRGFKSGGYNGNDPTNPPYGPEKLDAYEIGLKSEFYNHRLRLNSAAFYYNYSNIQVTKYTDTAVIYNGAGAEVEGLDLDGQTRITDSFMLSSGLEWIHSTFTSFPNAQFSTPLPTGGAALYAGDATGNRLPYAPNFTIDLSADYFLTVQDSTVDFNITDYFNSGYFTEADNNLRQSPYDLLNASVTWASPDEKYSVRLWANNLLDKAVLSQDVTQTVGYLIAYGNPPRTFGATLKYKF